MSLLTLLPIVVLAQQAGPAPAANEPRFVAERANTVTWNPGGRYLGYGFQEPQGHASGLGIYDLARSRGKILLEPKPDERIDQDIWLAGSPIRIVSTTLKFHAGGKTIDRKTLLALDGAKLTARNLWSQEFPEEQHARVYVEASPSLPHAIVSLKTDADKVYYVITLGADGVEMSSDIRQAIDGGYGFAGWTIDGTAFFGHGIVNDLAPLLFSVELNYEALQPQPGMSVIVSDDTLRKGLIVTGSVSINASSQNGDMTLWSVGGEHPSLAEGTVGLELVPTNGVLRQVRFRGFWSDPPREPESTRLDAQKESLKYGESSGASRSFWLAPKETDPPARSKRGLLVSPGAGQAWLHPDGKTVAYSVDGVLFVRTFSTPIR